MHRPWFPESKLGALDYSQLIDGRTRINFFTLFLSGIPIPILAELL